MPIWLIRSGKSGERENFALEQSVATIGWDLLPNLAGIESRDALTQLVEQRYPDKTASQVNNWVAQLWTFVRTIVPGDAVAMPSKLNPTVQFGRITGDYEYRTDFPSDARHARPVSWQQAVPRAVIPQDIRYSLGAFLTVCKIERNDAESRIAEILASAAQGPAQSIFSADDLTAEPELDLEELARDSMRQHISRNFAGHDLAKLVEAVLIAQGYKTRLSPPGPDGGVDILAGSGIHGFDQPRLAVQVKSGGTAVETSVFREFQGVMHQFSADHGLIVSMGGFKPNVEKEVPREFFRIRVWDDRAFISELTNVYDRLPGPIRAKLPLKRVWILAREDAE